jgi:hypothetical protein
MKIRAQSVRGIGSSEKNRKDRYRLIPCVDRPIVQHIRLNANRERGFMTIPVVNRAWTFFISHYPCESLERLYLFFD